MSTTSAPARRVASAWPAPSRLPVDARLVPARVTVAGLDGDYSDPDMLREAAAVLLRMAQQRDQERAR